MIFHKGVKYACISCIRGHRTSSCDHKDRPLLQVRKRGRPVPEDATRMALIPTGEANLCQCSPRAPVKGEQAKPCQDDDCSAVPRHREELISHDSELKKIFKPANPKQARPSATLRMKVKADCAKCDDPAGSPAPYGYSPSGSSVDEDHRFPVYTDKFVFIPVGDGLYRRENRVPVTASTPTATPTAGSSTSLTNTASSTTSEQEPFMFLNESNGEYKVESRESPLPQSDSFFLETGIAPNVIAPMDVDGRSVLQLGLTEEEAQRLWPSGLKELEYTASCAIPDQCSCGDGCMCENCFTHALRRTV